MRLLAADIRRDLDDRLHTSWLEEDDEGRNWFQAEFKCCGYYEFNVTAGSRCDARWTEPCEADIYNWTKTTLDLVFYCMIAAIIVGTLSVIAAFVVWHFQEARRHETTKETPHVPMMKLPSERAEPSNQT